MKTTVAKFVTIPFLTLLFSCSSELDNENEEQLGELDEKSAENEIRIFRIPSYAASGGPHLKVTAPRKHLFQAGEAPGQVFRPINYLTGEVYQEEPQQTDVGKIRFRVLLTTFDWEGKHHQRWKKYPEGNYERFGLQYRPIEVPGRPEKLWKRGYFKKDISGEEFYISCTPPIGPGSISAPVGCTMHLQLWPTEIDGIDVGALIQVYFRETQLSDWQEIERKTLDHFSDTIAVTKD